ncbi:MAG: helix-turn-helix transcriptional regulator [Clostridia bacterium]|nr:helix-turn-helix transcriptional regulator [Clostridia bacterium]
MDFLGLKYKLDTKTGMSKTYIFLLLLVCIIIFTLSFSIFSQTSSCVNIMTHSYTSQMESICQSSEQFINVISSSLNMMGDDNTFMNALTNTSQQLPHEDYKYVSQILRQTRKNASLYVDSIFMIDRQNSIICGTIDSEPLSMESTLASKYVYADYDYDYWIKYSNPLSARKILPVTHVSDNGSEKYIVPIVFSKINSIHILNPIVVNIDITKLLNSLSEHQLTPNTIFAIAGKQSKQCYFAGSEPQSIDDDFIDYISMNTTSRFNTTVAGTKYTAVAYSPSYSVLGYTYVSLIPQKDIWNLTIDLQFMLILVVIIAFITLAVLTRLLIKSIQAPYKQLIGLFDNTEKMHNQSPSVMLRYLSNSINSIVNTNKNLSSQITKIKPLENTQYLINLLNSNMRYISKDETEVLHKHIPEFKYDYFCSIIISFELTKDFYDMYNSLEYEQIKLGISKIIYAHFSEKFVTYTLPSTNDTYYILLNLEKQEEKNDILTLLQSFEKLFKQDNEYINIKIGVGDIYPYADGLLRSHNEAMNDFSVTNNAQIIVGGNDAVPYQLTITDENAIFNHLLSGQTEMAIKTINKVIDKNMLDSSQGENIRQLYVQIINIIFKVMRLKNLTYDHEGVGDLTLLGNIMSQSAEEVYTLIIKYIDVIKIQTQSSDKVDINTVIAYMQSHFHEDLYLDSVAEVFSTTSKYLSKKIKAELNVTFTEYLTFLRIEKAKRLLLSDDMSITDIYLSIGYNNRNTFIRCFKNYTGLTPSEFKKQSK